MYDEDSSVARWIARGAVAVTVTGAIAWWFYLNRPQRGPWSKSPRQNLAVLRDPARRESERRLAGDALEHADASIVPDLIAELKQGDALGRELAAIALGRLGAKASASVEPLVATLDDAEPAVRAKAVVAIERVCSHPQTVVAALHKAVHDGDSGVRDKAFESLIHQEAAGAQALVELVGDSDADVRRRAVIEVGRMPSEIAGDVDALRAARNDTDALVRAEALAALSHRRALDLDVLSEAVNDPDAIVQSTAWTLLGRMGPCAAPLVPELIAQLRQAFDQGDLKAAGRIAGTLSSIGPAARSATDALIDHAVHPPSSLNVVLRLALQGVGLESQYELPELLERAEAAGGEVKSLILWGLRPPRHADHPAEPASGHYEITDADLAHLSGLKNLELLNLNQTAIGDAGLAHLAGLTRLKSLQLWRTKVTSAGLVYLASMAELRSLSLAGCAITDEGLRHLRHLDHLESLSLSDTQVTNAGMHELAGLTRLEKIELGRTKVTDQGLAQLKHLPAIQEIEFSNGQFTLAALSEFSQLAELWLRDEPITDEDLAVLKGLTCLRNLIITGAPITDAGLKRLTELSNLRSLWLDKCEVTDRGAEELENALPGLRVNLPFRRQPLSAEYKVVGLDNSSAAR